MAVSKIHPIRKTLSKSFDYILDPAKTSNDLYVSSFRCVPPLATEEFLMIENKKYKEDMKKNKMFQQRKEYIHSKGIWTKYLKYLETELINEI